MARLSLAFRAFLALGLVTQQAVAERSGDGDVQVLMQRPPRFSAGFPDPGGAAEAPAPAAAGSAMEEPAWLTQPSSLARWAAALTLLVVLLLGEGERKDDTRKDDAKAHRQCPEAEDQVFRDDLLHLTWAWERFGSLRQALFYFCYCRHLRSNIYGISLALIALAANSGFVVLAFLEPPRHWNESLRILLASGALLLATTVESTMRSRYVAEASRTAAVALGLLAAKFRRLQASSHSAEELLQDEEHLREVFVGIFQVLLLPLQVFPVFIWLWTQVGPWALLLLLGGAPLIFTSCSRSTTVEAFLAYEKASRQRWDLLADAGSPGSEESEDRAFELRKQALDALQEIHYQSHSWALCLSRFVQLVALALLAFISARFLLLPPEVLLVIFLQCQFLLRHLSALSILRSPKLETIRRWEAILRQEEVAVAEVDGEICLEMKGCFDWNTMAEPSALPCLSNIALEARRGELVAIVGTAGAGKTSLLRAACGCLTPLGPGAQLRRSSSTIFLSSEPWIFPGSLQQNVLCGRPWNERRYLHTLEACGLDDATDVAAIRRTTRGTAQRIALARAAYGTEALVLLDDPFAGFSNEEVDQLHEIFHSSLFADRCCLVSFGTAAPQRQLLGGRALGAPRGRGPAPPGLRFILMEAGNMQVLQKLPEYLNNEAFCCPSAASTASLEPSKSRSPPVALPGDDASWLLATSQRSWLAALLVDQLLQLGIDWWIIWSSTRRTGVTGPLKASLMLVAVVVHLGSKLLLAKLGASSFAAAALSRSRRRPGPATREAEAAERQRDLKMPGHLWGRLAGSCTFFGLLGLSHLQLVATAPPWQLGALIPIYLLAFKALLHPLGGSDDDRDDAKPLELAASLRRSVELGKAVLQEPYFETHQEHLIAKRFARRPPVATMLMRLGPCVAAAYGLTAFLCQTQSVFARSEALILAPFGLLLQFVIHWTESFKD